MKAKDDLTLEYVRECLTYDPDTGVLRWRRRPLNHFSTARTAKAFNTQFAGKEAGTVNPCIRTEYRRIKINDRDYSAHRLAWLLHYGEWPADQIDHRNGNGLDNRIENLRVVSYQENGKNQRMYNNNVSGVTGVYWREDTRKWVARIRRNGRLEYLGMYDLLEEAVAARREAEQKYGFTERHGKPEVEPPVRIDQQQPGVSA